VRFDSAELLRLSEAERWAVYKTASEIGATDVAEIRLMEGRGPLGEPQVPVALQPTPMLRPAAVGEVPGV
jgi:hypothetical protein